MIKRNSMWAVARVLLSGAVRFFLTPLALQWLGVDDYGLWVSISAALALSGVMSEALAGSTQRQITAAIASGSLATARRTFSAGVTLFVILAMLIAIIGLGARSYLLGLIEVPAGHEAISSLLYNISLFGVVLSLMSTPYQGALVGSHRQDLLAVIQLAPNLGLLVLVLLLRHASVDPLLLFGSISCLASITNSALCIAMTHKLIPAARLMVVPNLKVEIRQFIDFAVWNLVARLNWILRNTGTIVVLSAHFGNTAAAAFSIANNLVLTVLQLSFAFTGVVQAEMTAAEVRGDRPRVRYLTFRVSMLQSALGLGLLCSVIYHGAELLAFWLGHPPLNSAHYLTLAVVYQIAPFTNLGEGMVMEARGRIRGIALAVALPQLLAFLVGVGWIRFGNATEFTLPHVFVFATLLSGFVIRPIYLARQGVLVMSHWLKGTLLPLGVIALACVLWSGLIRLVPGLPYWMLLAFDLAGWGMACVLLLRLKLPETMAVPAQFKVLFGCPWR